MLSWLFGSKFNAKGGGLPRNYRDLIDPDAMGIVRQLKEAGFESYLVGGCVRDLLLGNKPKDFDIATRATPQQVKAVVRRAFIIGKRFRIVVAKRHLDENAEVGNDELFPFLQTRPVEKEFQITTFRRQPVEVQGVINENVFGSPEEDAARRDFTINGLFLEPASGKILDFVGGLPDLQKRRLRIIGNPALRFREDPIRMLRALRFVARADLKFDPETRAALESCLPALADAKRERIREEVLKMLKEGASHKVFADFNKLGIWRSVNPAFAEALDTAPELEGQLERIAKAVSQNPWLDSHNAGPLFFLLLAPITLNPMIQDRASLFERSADEFKVSRKEREDIDRIAHFLDKIRKESRAADGGTRFLVENPKILISQMQAFYTLKVLADAQIEPYTKIWSQWESAWKKHLGFVLNVQRSASRRLRRPARSSPRRRSRGSRPAPRGPSTPA